MSDTLELILKASLLVQFVMLILLSMSLYSWFIIFAKRYELTKANQQAIKFLEQFTFTKDFLSLFFDKSASL